MSRKAVHVKKVVDGDTFEDDKGKKYRLENVDAPEKKEAGYQKAKIQLEKLIEDKDLSVQRVAKDRYGRDIVRAYDGRESINKKMQKKLGK